MARSGISQQQVFAAANHIAARGERPTVTGVRRELGDSGSHTTLLRHLTVWWDTQQSASSGTLTDVPQPLAKIIDSAMKEVWSTASRLAAQEIEAVRHAAQHRTAIFSDQLNDALTTLESLEQRNEQMEGELQQATELTQTLGREVAARDAELAILRQQLQVQADQYTATLHRLEPLLAQLLAQTPEDDPRKKAGADKFSTTPTELSGPQ